LHYIFWLIGIQGAADARLVGRILPTKGNQQTAFCFQAAIDFHNAVPTSQDIDESVPQLLQGCMGYGFLSDFDLLTNHAPNIYALNAKGP
jgi:hypothetical protein